LTDAPLCPLETALSAWCAADPAADALGAVAGVAINRAQLGRLLADGRHLLHSSGFVPGKRLAVIMPQGIDGAIAVLQAAAACDVAPLQPATPDLIAKLRTLAPAAVITAAHGCPEAEAAAEALDIPLIDAGTLRTPTFPTPMLRAQSTVAHHLVVATSGSTGTPKWAALDQTGLIAGCRATSRALELTEKDRLLLALPLNHTHGLVIGLLLPLLSGGRVLIAPRFDASEVLATLRDHHVTWLSLPPAMHRALAEQHAITPLRGHALRFLRSGSISMPAPLAERLRAAFGVPLIEAYGMTECPTIACNPLSTPRSGSVGRPVVEELLIVEPGGNPLPAGHWGQVQVRGAPSMRGYIKAHAGDQIRCPEDWFATGDEGRLDEDGFLYLRGRLDDAINRGGRMVRPAEVDAALADHPAVRDAVAFAVPHPSLGEDLAAAVVLAPGATTEPSSLNSYLAEKLPSHLVPSRIVTLTEIPVEPSGKVARRRLAERLSPILTPEFEEPRGQAERLIADLFHDVLADRVEPDWRPGRFTNFFLDGGDSLAAMRLLARLASHGWTDVSPQMLFERATPAELASALGMPSQQTQQARSERTDRADDAGSYPASSGQAGMWFLQQLDPTLTAYHLTQLWRLRGELDLSALTAGLTDLVRRHSTLRTSFRISQVRLSQIVHPPPTVELRVEDLSGRRPAEVIDMWLREEASTPFDLSSGMLMRARLLRIAPAENIVLLNHHHIASDGWSMVVLARDLSTFYNAHRSGTTPVIDPVRIPYHDYVIRHQERLRGEAADRLRAFWSTQLQDMRPLRLTNGSAPAAKAERSGASVHLTVTPSASAALESLCRSERATLQMGLLAALTTVLARRSGQDDIVIGVPAWGRAQGDLEETVGLFVNTLPIRIRPGESTTFRNLIRHVRSVSLAAYDHQGLPFEEMSQLLSGSDRLAGNPLVQVVLQLVEREYSAELDFDAVIADPLAEKEFSSRFDLEFELNRGSDGGLDGQVTFRTNLFDEGQIRQLAQELCEAIDMAAAQPDSPMGTRPSAGDTQTASWERGPDTAVPDRCLHQLFARRAADDPDAVAIISWERTLTVSELDAAANRLAHRLTESGVGLESVVAVCLDRSVDLVVALLAILKTGGAYLPIDPEWPAARKRLALAEIGPCPVVATSALSAAEWADDAVVVIDPSDPDLQRWSGSPLESTGHTTAQLAYVIFTSGSTGQPKGVLIEHRGVLRLLDPGAPWALAPDDRMLHLAPATFDAATLEIWLPLLSGATLVIAPPGPRGLEELGRLLVEQRISALWLTAELFHAMAGHAPAVLAGIRRLIAGGDVLDPRVVQSILNAMPTEHMLVNGYGPTESTTFATYHVMSGGSVLPAATSVPIGRPLAGTSVRVVGPTGDSCAIGVPGELWIGGAGLARGYLNSPELTAAKFTPDPTGGGDRRYRTGDLASWRSDGTLAFHGRIDEQVKVRGHRVDPGEVTAALSKHPAVVRAVAVPIRGSGGMEIAAYWIRRPGQVTTAEGLRAFLAETLPGPMIPSAFVEVDRLPVSPNGKLDRAALPPPHTDHRVTSSPLTATEQRIRAIWSDVLGHHDFGVTDNFFLVGGHSIHTVRLHARINEEFASAFPLSLVVGSPTVRQQAQWLSGKVDATVGNSALMTLQPDGDCAPLFAVHGWGGTLYHFVDIARDLAPRRPVLGLQPAGFGDPRILRGVDEMARSYADSIIDQVPRGLIHLVGHSAGGWYAFAVASALIDRGRTIGMLAILDSHAQGAKLHPGVRIRLLPLELPRRVAGVVGRLRQPRSGLNKDARIRQLAAAGRILPTTRADDDPYVALIRRSFRPPRLPITVDLFGPASTMPLLRATWRRYALGGLRCHPMLDTHQDFVRPDQGRPIARALESAMVAIEARDYASRTASHGLWPPLR
jgi:amino acid adenylation domain-containing protein